MRHKLATVARALVAALVCACPADAAMQSLGCRAKLDVVGDPNNMVTVKVINRTGTAVRLWTGSNINLLPLYGPRLEAGQSIDLTSRAGQIWSIQTDEHGCIDTIRIDSADTLVIDWVGARPTTSVAARDDRTYCEQNPGVCLMGAIIGGAALGAAAAGSGADSSAAAPPTGSGASAGAGANNQGCYRYTCPELNSWLYTPMNDPNRFAVNDLNACLGQAGGISAFSTRKSREDACRDQYCTRYWDSQCKGG